MSTHKKRSRFGQFLILLAILLVAIAIGINTYVFKSVKKEFGPADSRLSIVGRYKSTYAMFKNAYVLKVPKWLSAVDDVKFNIEEGQNVQQVCQNLEAQGIINDWERLSEYLIYTGKDRTVQPGSYTISNMSTTIDVANRIGDPRNRDIPLFVFAGWRIEEVASAIDQYALAFSGSDFLALAKNPPSMVQNKAGIKPGQSMEGYILPGSYLLKPEISLGETLSLMADRFSEKVINSGLKAEIENQGLSLHEGLTLASILQRETMALEEMPLMASVFYNRLKLGMKLETDVTVQYAVGWYEAQKTWWKSSLTWDDLAVVSPYNTYQMHGLPPGPLCSAGMASIEAVARPEISEFLFFRATCDGSGKHNFAKTYEEHLQNGCE